MRKNVIAVSLVAVLAAATALCAGCGGDDLDLDEDSIGQTSSALQIGSSVGGSNFNWYGINGCDRAGYGVIGNYSPYAYNTSSDIAYRAAHPEVAAIDTAITNMYNAGQRRMRIMVYHQNSKCPSSSCKDVGVSCTSSSQCCSNVCSSSVCQAGPAYPDKNILCSNSKGTHDLSAADKTRITEVVKAFARKGFLAVNVAMGPQGAANNPSDWTGQTTYVQAYFDENWNVIKSVRASWLAGKGTMAGKLDLRNEGLPPRPADAPACSTAYTNVGGYNYQATANYHRDMWTKYRTTYSGYLNETLGFSIIADGIAWRVTTKNLDCTYGSYKPSLYDIHFYGDTYDEKAKFLAMHTAMNTAGQSGKGWYIGEAFYNDATAASKLQEAITATGRSVFYLTQWPQTRAKPCSDVSVAPPTSFTNYK